MAKGGHEAQVGWPNDSLLRAMMRKCSVEGEATVGKTLFLGWLVGVLGGGRIHGRSLEG